MEDNGIGTQAVNQAGCDTMSECASNRANLSNQSSQGPKDRDIIMEDPDPEVDSPVEPATGFDVKDPEAHADDFAWPDGYEDDADPAMADLFEDDASYGPDFITKPECEREFGPEASPEPSLNPEPRDEQSPGLRQENGSPLQMEDQISQLLARVEHAGAGKPGEDDERDEVEQIENRTTPQPSSSRADSPLFEPEGPPMHPPSHSALPLRPPVPSSAFSKIRNLQQKINKAKVTHGPTTIVSQHALTKDDETVALLLVRQKEQDIEMCDAEKDDPERTNAEALADFKEKRKKYMEIKRKHNDCLPFREEVEWLRIQNVEQARQKKLKREQLKDRELKGEPSLFPEEDNPNKDDDDDHSSSDNDASHGSSSRKRQRPDSLRREDKRLSMREAELLSLQVALEADDDSPKKKKKRTSEDVGASAAPAPRGKSTSKGSGSKSKGAKTKGKAKTPATKVPRITAKQKRERQEAEKQTSSLFASNVFEQQAAEDAPDEPTFTSSRKLDALKELIASVPFDNKKAARGDMQALLAATKDFDGRGSVKPHGDSMWMVRGMKTSLKPYQVLGGAFMRRRENSHEQPKGGLMADQMGLGKTLMMLANIVNGRPPKNSKDPKTTLLVASPSLLTQWAKEIKLHTDCDLTMMRYSSGSRIDSNRSLDILGEHDIVMTTYTEVMRSYPKNEPPIECQTAEEKISWWKNVFETQRGVLHHMLWHRVVLDEAQAIKNHTGRTSIACRALMAEHKWALSGTPVLNRLTELYPYFKFLGVPHTGSFKIFKHNYCAAGDPETTERLLLRLSQFMIRRTHADSMFGAPLLKLPKAEQATHWCEFNELERNIYDIVRERFAAKINTWSKQGELDKSYSNVLVMLLRLRQLTAHMLMLQFVMQDLLEREDIERIKEVTKAVAVNDDNVKGRQIHMIREQLKELTNKQRNTAQKDHVATEDDTPVLADEDVFDDETPAKGPGLPLRNSQAHSGKGFGRTYNFEPFIKSLQSGVSWEKAKEKSKCGGCPTTPPVEPFVTSCHHLFCKTCVEEMQTKAAELGKEHASCRMCGKVFHYAIPCEEEGESQSSGPETRSKSSKRKGQGRIRPELEQVKDDWLSMGGDTVLPSAKTIAIKAQILNWIQENPKVKIIVYTQFLAMIRILGRVCEEEGWGTQNYHGGMGFTARDKAIETFSGDQHCRILLASLRAGGLGLNLTMASRVIVIDPWWNSAAEQQAFCRVFRIGQQDTTSLTRFCVRNTVDQRLIDMQERKKAEIDEVMEDDGTRAKKLGIRDLMRLFGNIRDDESGRPYILVDNPSDRGGFRADPDDECYADDV